MQKNVTALAIISATEMGLKMFIKSFIRNMKESYECENASFNGCFPQECEESGVLSLPSPVVRRRMRQNVSQF